MLIAMAGPVGAWPVILHQSLVKSEISRLLRQKNFKIRNSESVTNNSIIFPMSGVAFMILHLKDVISDGCIRAEVWESIDKFIQVHRRCYILAEAPCHAEQEQCVFSAIQENPHPGREYPSNVKHFQGHRHTLRAANDQDVEDALFKWFQAVRSENIPLSGPLLQTKADELAVKLGHEDFRLLCKPMGEVVTGRFQGVLTHAMCGDVTGAALTQLGLTEPQIQFIQDGIGNLAQLASASREDLLNCSLDTDTADRILDIFHK